MWNNQLSQTEFKEIKNIVFKNTGINLTESKKALIVSRLSKRLRELKLASFSEYINYIKSNKIEMEKFSNKITTNVTHFFREKNHFEYLQNKFLPQIKTVKTKHELRCWSAGCSTGEEPYTIAIVLNEFFEKNNWKLKILASDINTEVLNNAARGIFSQESVKKIPYNLLTKYFRLGTGDNKGYFKVKKKLRKLITFKKINLNQKNYPIKNELDFIFCRNVFIYFDKDTQIKILKKFHNKLRLEGRLFLGHSERINPENCNNNCWELCAPTVYKKL